MEPLTILLVFLSIFFSLVIMDSIWLGKITNKFIIREFGELITLEKGSLKLNLKAGALAWIAIAFGCYIFVVVNSTEIIEVLTTGALFGFIAYSIYDLTNLTFIKNYPKKFAALDILWGTFLCSCISAIGYLVKGLL